MTQLNNTDTIDDAADTLRFVRPSTLDDTRRDFDFEAPTDPDATSIYDLRAAPPPRYVGRERSPRRRRQIRDTRENLLRLREALAEGWNIAPELAHEERRLSALMASAR